MKDCSRLFVFIMILTSTVFSSEATTESSLVRAENAGILAGSVVSVLVNARAASREPCLGLGLQVSSINSGRVRYDSAAWVGSLIGDASNDLNVTDASRGSSLTNTLIIEGSWPDGLSGETDSTLAFELFFTLLKAGRVSFEVVTLPEKKETGQPATRETTPAYTCRPAYVTIAAAAKQNAPVLLTSGPLICRAGDCVDIEVVGGWPDKDESGTVRVSLFSPDRGWTAPDSRPRFDTLVPATFTWCPSDADIGIWIASFQSPGVSEWSDETTVEIQVVSSDQTMLSFGEAISLMGPLLDAAGGGSRRHSPIPLPVTEVTEPAHDAKASTPLPSAAPPQITDTRLVVGGDFDGDAFPDSAFIDRQGVFIRWGKLDGLTEDGSQIFEGEVTAIGAADLNGDGLDDLIVGTRSGLLTFQDLDEAEFAVISPEVGEIARTSPQAIATVCVGFDFNRDQHPDVAFATVVDDAGFCRLIVYHGTTDGTFRQAHRRRLLGQVSSLVAGDINGDGWVDLAYVNRIREYVGIILCQADSSLRDELRYRPVAGSLSTVAVHDYDLDGDLDLLLETSEGQSGSGTRTVLMTNRLDREIVPGNQLELRAGGNAQLRLVAPNGLSLSAGDASIIAGDFSRVALDTLPEVDAVIKVDVLLRGAYEIIVTPYPDLTVASTFWLEYSVNGIPYALAQGLANREEGYRFTIYPDGDSPISPSQGEFIESALPTFAWRSEGTDRFELATDINFSHIIETATVTGGLYTLHTMLPSIDSVAYYWRVRSEVEPNWEGVNVFNRLHASGESGPDLENSGLPQGYDLAQNYPNPFNPLTTIEYYLPQGMPVRMTVHNVLGQLIYVLVDRFQSAGQHTVDWLAQDETGHDVASGIYFYRLEAGGLSLTRKMVLVR